MRSDCLSLIVVLFFAGALAGCGSGAVGPAAVSQPSSSQTTASAVASPMPPPVERLPGKWQGEMIVYEDTVQGKLTPQQITELLQKRLDLEFAADGTMTTSAEIKGQATATHGQWNVLSQDGDLLTIQSIEQGSQPREVHIEFDGADTFFIPLKTEVAELGAMKFTRLR